MYINEFTLYIYIYTCMAIIIFISLKIFQQRHILDLCNLRIMDKTGKVDAAILGIIDKINQVNTDGIVDGYSRQ